MRRIAKIIITLLAIGAWLNTGWIIQSYAEKNVFPINAPQNFWQGPGQVFKDNAEQEHDQVIAVSLVILGLISAICVLFFWTIYFIMYFIWCALWFIFWGGAAKLLGWV